MNDTNPPAPAPSAPPPLHPSPAPIDTRPVAGVGAAVEAILHQPLRVSHHFRQLQGAASLTATFVGVALAAALAYGLAVGAFSGGTQWWAAPVKMAVGLLASALICLPSLFIFACLSGSTARLREVVGLLAGLLALMTILLVGFAPVAWVFSQSTESVVAMGVLHLAFGAVATGFALRFLDVGLSERGGQLGGVRIWMVIFVLVLVQMTTALRPLLGTADTFLPTEKRFFLSHWSECLRDQAKGAE